MTFLTTSRSTGAVKRKYIIASLDYVTFSSTPHLQKDAIVEGMTSSFKTVAKGNTSLPTREAEIEARWDRILSFAGAWEGEDAMTIEDLEELRRNAWGNRLDVFDEDEDQENNP